APRLVGASAERRFGAARAPDAHHRRVQLHRAPTAPAPPLPEPLSPRMNARAETLIPVLVWMAGARQEEHMSRVPFVRVAVASTVVLSVAACMVRGTKEHFMQTGISKAAFDMHCAREQLNVTQLGDNSVGVQGCGTQARYEFVDETGGWYLDS